MNTLHTIFLPSARGIECAHSCSQVHPMHSTSFPFIPCNEPPNHHAEDSQHSPNSSSSIRPCHSTEDSHTTDVSLPGHYVHMITILMTQASPQPHIPHAANPMSSASNTGSQQSGHDPSCSPCRRQYFTETNRATQSGPLLETVSETSIKSRMLPSTHARS